MAAEPARSVSISDLKAHASEVLRAVEQGEVVTITRRGEPVAILSPVRRQRVPLDLEWHRRLSGDLPVQTEDSGTFVRRMRDADRA